MANIFFIMPFRPGLNYMFLYLKNSIESTFPDARCIRGDSRASTGFLINKIRADIEEADVIIADCSGQNPNVFYELGVAHALGKEVILINSDSNAEIPTDIRAYDQLLYSFHDDEAFCSKIHKVLDGLMGNKYDVLYKRANEYIKKYNSSNGVALNIKSVEKFKEGLMSKENATKIPPLDDDRSLSTFLLPLVVDDVLDLDTATDMRDWIRKTYPLRRS